MLIADRATELKGEEGILTYRSASARGNLDDQLAGMTMRTMDPGELPPDIGFDYHEAIEAGISSLDLLSGPAPSAGRTVVIASEERPEYARLRDHLGAELHVIAEPGNWDNSYQFELALLPNLILGAIAAALAETAA